jgi:Domain of unknown function (DUF5666)
MVRGLVAIGALLVLAPAASAANPVSGSVFGPVVSVNGSTFTITTSLSPSGKSLVSAGSARITEQAAVARSALKVGACVMATGAKNSKGVVAATRIGLSAAVKGKCGGGFGFGRGTGGTATRPPGTGTPPANGGGGFQRSGNFGFAFGSVTKVSGSTLTVKGTDFRTKKATTTTVTVSAKTTISETKAVKAADVKTKMCAFVRGTSTDKGVTVKASNVALTPETNGSCTNGFRGGPGR